MILQALETLPSCLASSSRPALARMIFWSLVMTVSSGSAIKHRLSDLVETYASTTTGQIRGAACMNIGPTLIG